MNRRRDPELTVKLHLAPSDIICVKSGSVFIILATLLFCAETVDIFTGGINRSEVRGRRVSVSGYVNATGCEKLPCKLMAYRWIDGAKVLFILNFPDRFQPFVSRKNVLDPIRASCVMISDFEYGECYF